MSIEDFFRLVGADNERRPGVHFVPPGARTEDVRVWQSRTVAGDPPVDFIDLWRQSNGLGLWRETSQGEYIHQGALQFHPLEEVRAGARAMYGGDEPADPYSSWLVLASDADGTYFLVFDVQTARYLQVPAICPKEAKAVATGLGDLLEWIVTDLKLVGGELPSDD